MNKYDIIVLGAGPAGIASAKRLAEAGKKVLVVDTNIGANYLMKGSVLSNSALYYSYLYDIFKNKTKQFLKIDTKDIEIDFKSLKKQIDSIRNKLSKLFINEISQNPNIEICHSEAVFTSESSILADDKEYFFDNLIIATGSLPLKLSPVNNINFLTLENFLNMKEIPEKIAIIGGGYIGIEIATIFKRFGSQVIIIEKDDRILKDFDEYIAKKFEERLKKGGIAVLKNCYPEKIEKIGNKTIIFLCNGDQIETNEIFVSIGRKPNIEKLNVDKAKIKLDKNGKIKLNNYLQTSNKKIYVVGDATGFNMFVNWSYKSSEIVCDNILGFKKSYKNVIIPKLIFSDPEIACIGLTEKEAVEKNIDYEVVKYSYADMEKSAILGYSKGLIKVIFNNKSKKILGAHILGKGASELVNVFGLMIQLKMDVNKMKECIFDNPLFATILTDLSEAIMEK
ncbi:NAD(P)/FAD-dependent oxidoreductase [Deferribacter thermophilus]|uniref:dihydrolipoyl dehydrogenase family protein n=1 Tax=Deferribacter thermophilus TaxID=53573 RepID=UPI003C1FD4D3